MKPRATANKSCFVAIDRAVLLVVNSVDPLKANNNVAGGRGTTRQVLLE